MKRGVQCKSQGGEKTWPESHGSAQQRPGVRRQARGAAGLSWEATGEEGVEEVTVELGH